MTQSDENNLENIPPVQFEGDFGRGKTYGNLVPLGLSADVEDPAWLWDQFLVNRSRLVALTNACIQRGVTYRYGSKPAWPVMPPNSPHMFARIDCSGFVGWLLTNAMGFDGLWARGSVEQREWIEPKGFKVSTPDAGMLRDGAVRIAFLPPGPWRPVGHVVLILDGQTLESCGSRGVCRRNWGSEDWMGSPDLRLWVLCPPLPVPRGEVGTIPRSRVVFSALGQVTTYKDLEEEGEIGSA